MKADEHNRANYHDRDGSFGHDGDALSAFYRFPSRQRNAEICAVLRQSSPRGGIWSIGRLQLKKRKFNRLSARDPRLAFVVVLHLWKRQMLLSIAGGTVLYMVLVQTVF